MRRFRSRLRFYWCWLVLGVIELIADVLAS